MHIVGRNIQWIRSTHFSSRKKGCIFVCILMSFSQFSVLEGHESTHVSVDQDSLWDPLSEYTSRECLGSPQTNDPFNYQVDSPNHRQNMNMFRCNRMNICVFRFTVVWLAHGIFYPLCVWEGTMGPRVRIDTYSRLNSSNPVDMNEHFSMSSRKRNVPLRFDQSATPP